MAVSLKHTTVAVGTDAGNGEIAKAQWNEEHTLTAAANSLLGTTTAGAVGEISCTAAGRALLDDADAAAQRTTLAAAGTGVTNTFTANQTFNGNVSIVTSAVNANLYLQSVGGSGRNWLVVSGTNGTFSIYDATAAASRVIVDANGDVGIGKVPAGYKLDINGTVNATALALSGTSLTPTATEFNYLSGVTSAIQTQLGNKQPLDAELTALAGLTSAADRLPYFTGSGTAALTTLTSFSRGLLDDADAATARSTLGLANALLSSTTATITTGYTVTSYNIGTVSSGTTTLNPANGNYQYYTNNGAHTLAAPSSDCAIDILITNGASAGSITFSGFQVGSSTGSALTTTSGHDFIISVRRINSLATYSIYAMQ